MNFKGGRLGVEGQKLSQKMLESLALTDIFVIEEHSITAIHIRHIVEEVLDEENDFGHLRRR